MASRALPQPGQQFKSISEADYTLTGTLSTLRVDMSSLFHKTDSGLKNVDFFGENLQMRSVVPMGS